MGERQKVGLGDYVYRHIKDMLLDGGFAPDVPIPIDALAAELGVSRQPVMDAMRKLGIEGFIRVVPQVGCYCRRYGAQDIQDFFRLFAEGEAFVAELACERAKPDDLAGLRLLSAEIGNLRDSRETGAALAKQYRQLNRRFHAEMRRIADSEAVTEHIERLGDQSDFFISSAGVPIFNERLRTAHDEHEALIAAIADRKPQLARAVMVMHILAIAGRIRTTDQDAEQAATVARKRA